MSKSFHCVSRRNLQSGFTLIELLIVIAIIALLAAILFPSFIRARENARRSACQSNLKQIGLGIMQYAQVYDERLPPGAVLSSSVESNGETINGTVAWQILVQPYVKSIQVFVCPSNRKGRIRVSGTGSTASNFIGVSYVCNGRGNDNITTLSSFDWGGDAPMSLYGTYLKGGAQLARMTSASQVITVVENSGASQGAYIYDWVSLAATGTTEFTDHLRMTNFLFADGHVKAMKPTATYFPLNMWTVNNTKSTTSDTYLGSDMRSQDARLDG